MGNCLQHEGRYAEAMDFYDRVLQQRPDYPDIHARLGVIFCDLQRYQESIDSLKRAFRMKHRLKEESCYGVTFAISLAYLGKTEEALEAYRAAVRQNPKDAKALAGVGWALLKLGNYAGADPPLRAAIKVDPGHGRPYLHLSFVLAGLGKYDESLAAAEQFAALKPKDPLAHSNLVELRLQIGTAQLKLGNWEAARIQCQLLQAMGSDKAEELRTSISANDHRKS
jgi:tetratricopeptide (TPR) repeat protein